jgi:dihydropteroate synthase
MHRAFTPFWVEALPLSRPQLAWQLKTRTLPLGERTLLMGIVNITPDSFSDGGQFVSPTAAVDHSLRLLEAGADLLDLGAESTRPGSTPISAAEEQHRLLPVLKELLRVRPDAILSVDTYHAATAEAALAAGAEIINDVSGLLWDAGMPAVLARHHPGTILMHTRGRPADWPTQARLAAAEVLPCVRDGLARTLALAQAAGIEAATIVLDPGFGFGKLGAENFTLLNGLAELHALGRPLLAGVSRKRFLTAHLAQPTVEERRDATSAANVAAVLAGAHILRVHDIVAARLSAQIADRILNA